MNVKQEFIREEVQRRAEENSQMYFENELWWLQSEDIDPEESYWWWA